MSSGLPGPADQVGGQPPNPFDGPAEDDEATGAKVERVGNGARLVRESTVGAPPEGGKDQPAGFQRLGGAHAGVTVPRTRGPRAPVAAGTLPGWP